MIQQSINEQKNNTRVKIFKALADPIRLQIIWYLNYVNREITCGEIDKVLNISKSAGSYHFKILREAELTITRKSSREKYVTLNYTTFDKYVIDFWNYS
ncbi:metalloregulator ArsR/SmtB family transcription factor [Bombilactobacillus folatiphilus]|uniref:Metalloregulator ArsR/SmtB family transcription factor n=1 Tax=Bombilactobacillus folatiphilus TaxID=2923362 RepID=A0ABY4PAV8_9LACO|nr:metalloregulator ArsR/SmtB family transcription factor [Bombilactobacillus folatiphilus]UQS82893.1 metalloregulator ArsR/SmtB family transcription factor [Bombilactobacillus folatiphilus]